MKKKKDFPAWLADTKAEGLSRLETNPSLFDKGTATRKWNMGFCGLRVREEVILEEHSCYIDLSRIE